MSNHREQHGKKNLSGAFTLFIKMYLASDKLSINCSDPSRLLQNCTTLEQTQYSYSVYTDMWPGRCNKIRAIDFLIGDEISR